MNTLIAGLILASASIAEPESSIVLAVTTVDSCETSVRPARLEDVLLRDRNPLWGAPANANDAPGPGFRAVVRTDSLRHAFVFIVDSLDGTTRRLGKGCMPRVSPDGQWVACNRWLSRERPWMLALVNLKTGEDHVLDAVEHIEDYAWSPDSKHLAFTSFPYTDQWENRIGWIDPKTAEVHVLARDRQSYVEYYDLEWAPDSRRFIVNRMREYEHDHDQNIYAHDLWLFHISGRACQLTRTPKVPEDFPGWVDGHRISYEVIDEGGRTRFVIMLPR